MSRLAVAVQRFPDREMEIHRLCARDPEFLSVCEDFADARAALDHWRAMGVGAAERAEEYRVLAEELASEVFAALEARRIGKRDTGT